MATGLPKSKANGSTGHQRSHQAGGEIRLDYEGKRNAAEIIANCPRGKLTIAQSPKKADGWTNRLYFGDNLEVLGTLLDDPTVRGKVSLIYIDPPYSTNSVFESREQKFAYHDLLSGAAFVEFLRERLIVLRELLSERGSIYVHLDENMAFLMKIVMDEVFGAENFCNFITRKKCNTKNYTRRTYGNISDYILFYSKTDNYVWNRPVIAWTDEGGKRNILTSKPQQVADSKKFPFMHPAFAMAQLENLGGKCCRPPASIGNFHQAPWKKWIAEEKSSGHRMVIPAAKSIWTTAMEFRCRTSGWTSKMHTIRTLKSPAILLKRILKC